MPGGLAAPAEVLYVKDGREPEVNRQPTSTARSWGASLVKEAAQGGGEQGPHSGRPQ